MQSLIGFVTDMVVDIKSRTGDSTIWLILNDILFADQSMFNEDLLQIEFVNRSFDKYQSVSSTIASIEDLSMKSSCF